MSRRVGVVIVVSEAFSMLVNAAQIAAARSQSCTLVGLNFSGAAFRHQKSSSETKDCASDSIQPCSEPA